MNAIAGNCKLEGTIRAFKDKDLEFLKKLIDITALQSAEKFDLDYRIEYGSYYRHVNNDSKLIKLLQTVAAARGISLFKF